jgi:hypothetical protein
MTRALYKSLLMLKEIRVKLLQRTAFLSGTKDLQLSFAPLKSQCRSFALKPGAQDDMHVGGRGDRGVKPLGRGQVWRGRIPGLFRTRRG